MEHKIGEIFEYNGELYQCVTGECKDCNLSKDASYCNYLIKINFCKAKSIFKKLEKVGEPTIIMGKMVQEFKNNNDNHCEYCCFNKGCHPLDIASICDLHNSFFVELKQNKEDMEEKKIQHYDCFFDKKEKDKLNLKPFDLKSAKLGKPVCTRDGCKARIICFDAKFPKTGNIVTLVEKENGEEVTLYHYDDGHCSIGRGYDLMMLPEKKEGWAKVRKDINLYDTKEEADRKMIGNDEYVTAKVCWEE